MESKKYQQRYLFMHEKIYDSVKDWDKRRLKKALVDTAFMLDESQEEVNKLEIIIKELKEKNGK